MDYYITDYQASGENAVDDKTSGENAVALEDSIMKKGSPVTAGSKMLKNFISPFDATVVTRLQKAGIPITGKTTMREFGIAEITADMSDQVTDTNKTTGGSDKPDQIPGAVRAVAGGTVPFALCNDVFGTYRSMAAKQGLYYIHPTYGTVSRFGLIPLVSSMDQIGVVCKDLKGGFELLSTIAGKDENDGAMFPETSYSYKKRENINGENAYSGNTKSGTITIGIPEAIAKKADQNTQESISSFAKKLNTEKLATVNMKLPYFDVYKQTMYILSCGEISNNINRYDGIKFGYRTPNHKGIDDLYKNTRTEAFELETKLAAIMGCMVLSKDQYIPYYEKAMKLRRLIKESLKFDQYDLILLPTEISEDPYENLSLFSLATLAGLPSISFNYQSCGMQLIANVKNENALWAAGEVAKQ